MAQASKTKRRDRRLKRQVTLLGRLFNEEQKFAMLQQRLQQEQAGAFFAKTLLCTILAQKGGDVEVTQGTFQQVLQNVQNLGFKTEQSKTDPNAMRVILTEGPQQQTQPEVSATSDTSEQGDSIVDAIVDDHPLMTPVPETQGTAVVD